MSCVLCPILSCLISLSDQNLFLQLLIKKIKATLCGGSGFGAVLIVREECLLFEVVLVVWDGSAGATPVRSFTKQALLGSNLSLPLAKAVPISTSSNKPI